jgi:uncharacterized membrane protein (UPF0136 family)
MEQISVWSIIIYAFLVAFGGIFGYLKAKSKPSLISGVASGVALGITWFIARNNPKIGVGIAGLIAAVLLVTFIIRLIRTRKFMPAGLMMLLSLAATIVFGLGWFA